MVCIIKELNMLDLTIAVICKIKDAPFKCVGSFYLEYEGKQFLLATIRS